MNYQRILLQEIKESAKAVKSICDALGDSLIGAEKLSTTEAQLFIAESRALNKYKTLLNHYNFVFPLDSPLVDIEKGTDKNLKSHENLLMKLIMNYHQTP